MKKTRTLTLHRETLLQLQHEHLRAAGGRADVETDSCYDDCCSQDLSGCTGGGIQVRDLQDWWR